MRDFDRTCRISSMLRRTRQFHSKWGNLQSCNFVLYQQKESLIIHTCDWLHLTLPPTHLITYPTPQSRVLLEKITVSQLTKELATLQNHSIHYCIHNSPPFDLIPSQINPFHTLPTNCCKVNCNNLKFLNVCDFKTQNLIQNLHRNDFKSVQKSTKIMLQFIKLFFSYLITLV